MPNTIMRADVTEVSIGLATLQGLMGEDGNFYVALPQLSKFLSFSRAKNNLSRDVKSLIPEASFIKLRTKLHPKAVNALTIKEFLRLTSILAANGNKSAQDLVLNSPESFMCEAETVFKSLPAQRKRDKVSTEKQIQQRLKQLNGGQVEVLTPAGRIDLLTSTQLIEIKKTGEWKAAIGQLMVYGHYYPSHQKRLHLFGGIHSEALAMVQKHCEKLGIVVTVEA